MLCLLVFLLLSACQAEIGVTLPDLVDVKASASALQMKRMKPMGMPSFSTYVQITGSAAEDVWAIGDDATLVHYDGNEWALSFTGAQVVALHALDKKNAIAIDSSSTVRTFNGARWSNEFTYSLPSEFVCLFAESADRFYTYDGNVFDYTRTNGTWSRRLVGAPQNVWTTDSFSRCTISKRANELVISGHPAKRFDGQKWVELVEYDKTAHDVLVTTDTQIFSLTQRIENGKWTDNSPPKQWGTWNAQAGNTTHLVLVGERSNQGVMAVWDGAQWKQATLPQNTPPLHSVWVFETGEVVAGGALGTLLNGSL
jgi:hypothetical protein